MLSLSARLAKLPKKQQSNEMRQKLYESQANDAYWHGMFGGLYLPHLRRALYKAMLELEVMLDACKPRRISFVEDTDLDGVREVYLHNGTLQAIVKLDSYASICELDAYELHHNFGDTLRRQIEHYYQKYKQGIEILRNTRVMVLPRRMIESASNMKSMHRISLPMIILGACLSIP